MIGDNLEADIQGAKNAGIPSVFYNPLDETDTVGGRVQFDPITQITLGAELAYQFGNFRWGGGVG